AEIRRWISRHGGLTSRMIYLEGKELAALYPPCRRPIRSLKKLQKITKAAHLKSIAYNQPAK
ncbi:MAG: hypothetical protein WCD13_14450, partial [Pseudolabrys sp.]